MKIIFRNEKNFQKKIDFKGGLRPGAFELKLNPEEDKALGDYWAIRCHLHMGVIHDAEKILKNMQPHGRKMEGRYYALAAGAIALYYKTELKDEKAMNSIFKNTVKKLYLVGNPGRTDYGGMVAIVEMMAIAGEQGLVDKTMSKLGPLSTSQASVKVENAKLYKLPDY